jgi:hypothetical protein
MEPALSQAQAAVAELVDKFARNLDSYRQAEYKEAEVRHEFIEPFFAALGWDVHNAGGYAEAYKDVVNEESLRGPSGIEAPDYTFRIGGVRKFFVEAKKPAISVRADAGPAYQLRRYAWSAKLPLSILTDFEELAVYDCTRRPREHDKAGIGRVAYYTFDQYAERLPQIWDVFAKQSVLRGSFDRYAQDARKKRGTSEVDQEILKEIEGWRETLARNLALRNTRLTVQELNFAVQSTIDRILFLRVAEDRGSEEYGRLQALLNGVNTYGRLADLYRQADAKYNSGLFDFRADTLTLPLQLDDRVLKGIIAGLYYPQSPYEFSMVSADILGQVYEQFLGKVIRLTTAHHAVVEEKPEVKKAGGVYYTPTYIVDYIVQHTVGELVKDKTPQQVEKLRTLDPACGSGSFLLGAYQCLLRYHLDWYTAHDPEKWAARKGPAIRHVSEQEWRLTTAEKKRILLNNIYGVDIDRQAVEVTKLNLMLKVLEGETQETLQPRLIHERALPDLGKNIQCGNSLIERDYWDRTQMTLFDEEEVRRVNAFDWQAAFPQAIGAGGFDATIGNPPYGAAASAAEIEYYRSHYISASATTDSYALFIEAASRLLRPGGRLGMIVQSGWVSAPGMLRLREVFASRFRPLQFASMPYDVFGAYVDTVIVTAERIPSGMALSALSESPVELVVFPPRFKIRSVDDFAAHVKAADAAKWVGRGSGEFLITLSDTERLILDKVRSARAKFADVADIQRGVTPLRTSPDEPPVNPARAFLGTVRRYSFAPGPRAFIRYDETLAEYKPPRYFEGPRLLLRELISRQSRLQGTYTDESFITNKSMQSLLLTDNRYHIWYLLGILNSSLLSWYFLAIHSVGRRDDFPKIVLQQTRDLPFRSIHFGQPADAGCHDRLVALVQRMLELHKVHAAARMPADRELYARQIEATDREIDALVYELYGLTQDEIAVVEGAVGG